ncbi:MAG: spermidine/putrescine ABC transporter substrate-binding protein, partial [Cyanobacteriota bacterium]|nr:spermidine/putrescine ABC transporter substrate-binding protein [Cyanobacteriota bacterium]
IRPTPIPSPMAPEPGWRPMSPGPSRSSRRRFLQRLALAAGTAGLAQPLLQACRPGERSASGGAQELVISNFPLYIDTDRPGFPGTVKRFEAATGIRVRYSEDINDVRQFFARIRPELAAGRSLPQDLVVLTSWMAERLIRLGWVDPLPLSRVPNTKHLLPSLRHPSWDPEQRYSLPWQSGIAGIAYNIKATGRELRSMDDLFDPALKGRVSALLEMRDTMGLLMLADGKDISRPTWPSAAPSFARLEQARRNGQIRRFTGNDYQNDLLVGNLAACIGWSGDVAQLAMDQPDLRFVVPDSGGILWADVMLMPKGARHAEAVAQWLNWVYDPAQAARIAAQVQYISPVVGVQEVLAADPATANLARNSQMFPGEAMQRRLHVFGPLSESEEARWEERFARITEG